MAPRLRAAGDGVLMTWIEPSDVRADAGRGAERQRVRFARLSRNGRWSAASTIAEGSKVVANWADAPSVALAGDGSLVAHWGEKSGAAAYAYDVVLARSSDGGVWRRIGRAHDDGTATEHGFVSLVAEGDDVRAFWLDGRETAGGDHGHRGATTLRTAVIRGERVTDGEVLDGRVCDCCGTSAAVTKRGPLIVYRDRSDEEIRDIASVARVASQWSEPRVVERDGWTVPGCPVNGPALAADGERVAIAWYTYAGERGRVRAALSSDAGRTWGTAIDVDAPARRRAPIGRVDVALDGDGAVVSWLSSERAEASIQLARVAADGRVGEPLVVARTGASRDTGFPQLERFADRLLVAWTTSEVPSRIALRALRAGELAAPKAPVRVPDEGAPALLQPGAQAPDYSARSLDGERAALSSLRGEVVLLNVWASWCEPCRHELGELTELHARHGGKGLRVVAVSVDGRDRDEALRAYLARRKLLFTVWRDAADQASSAFGVATLPASFLIDRRGRVVWSKSGALTARDAELLRALEAALGGAP
jgi:peroxiredoxin